MHHNLLTLIALAAVCCSPLAALGAGKTELRNICHIKGQEENTLRGLGLVVGLNGTGEAGDLQTMRALSSAMEIMGSPVSTTGRSDAKSLEELKKIKNVALVMVTATVPGTGARRGDKLDCFVSALNGKSLEGGRLAFASLQGPNTQDRQVYGVCEGQVTIDNHDLPTVGRIHLGCQMQQDVTTPYLKDGYVTLILDHNHADFMVADDIGNQILEMYREQFVGIDQQDNEEQLLLQSVQVIDAGAIRVKVPEILANSPVNFIAQLMEIPIYYAEPEARVVINPRAETIVISGDVVIGNVLVSHRNLTIESLAPAASFKKVDQGSTADAKLEQLLQALQDLQVPASDIIEIVQGIERNGKLHGRLIIE